jgi:hypothetical protein
MMNIFHFSSYQYISGNFFRYIWLMLNIHLHDVSFIILICLCIFLVHASLLVFSFEINLSSNCSMYYHAFMSYKLSIFHLAFYLWMTVLVFLPHSSSSFLFQVTYLKYHYTWRTINLSFLLPAAVVADEDDV